MSYDAELRSSTILGLYTQEIDSINRQISKTLQTFIEDIHNPELLRAYGPLQHRQVPLIPEQPDVDLLAATPLTTRDIQEQAVSGFRKHRLGYYALGPQITLPFPRTMPTHDVTLWHFITPKGYPVIVEETRSRRSPYPEDTGLALAFSNFVPRFVPRLQMRRARYVAAQKQRLQIIKSVLPGTP